MIIVICPICYGRDDGRDGQNWKCNLCDGTGRLEILACKPHYEQQEEVAK